MGLGEMRVLVLERIAWTLLKPSGCIACVALPFMLMLLLLVLLLQLDVS